MKGQHHLGLNAGYYSFGNAWQLIKMPNRKFVCCVCSPGDNVAASHVSDSSRQEGHGHPGKERVLHATGRE